MLERFTDIASALSDPTRVRVLASLLGGRDEELCVCEVTELFDLAPSTVSKHLLVLRKAGLVEGRKDGRWMYYRPARQPEPWAAQALTWVRQAATADPQLRSDAGRLRELLQADSGCCPSDTCCSPSPRPTKLLFLCTGNSCRSQMADGWARALLGSAFEPDSAGTKPHGLNPLAVRAMAEAGVDISTQTSKHIDEVIRQGVAPDVLVTVCNSARETCPTLPGSTRVLHASFDDPPQLAAGARSDDEALPHYRRVRDEIRAFVESLPERLHTSHERSQSTTQLERNTHVSTLH